MLNVIPWKRQIARKDNLQIHNSTVLHMELKHGNLTKVQNKNLDGWKWIL